MNTLADNLNYMGLQLKFDNNQVKPCNDDGWLPTLLFPSTGYVLVVTPMLSGPGQVALGILSTKGEYKDKVASYIDGKWIDQPLIVPAMTANLADPKSV